MSHLLFEDISSVLSEEYLEEKADVKAMIADFDQDALSNAIHDAIKELDPEAEVGGNLDNVTSRVVSVLMDQAPIIQNNFQREDRVVWAIKFLKFQLLCSVGSTAGTWYNGKRFTADQMSVELFKKVFSKMNFMKKLQKTQGRDSVEQEYTAFGTGGTYPPMRATVLLGALERYLETGIKAIEDFVWDPSLTYTYLKRELEGIYEDYKEQLKGWARVDEDDGDKIIIAYKPEKLYWFNLNKAYCSREQEAAGHCGNQPREFSGDNLYSLSTLKKVGKEWYRYPHVTVVLEDTGLLGEIKGRGNTTPHEKYGDKLVDLCLLPEVKGIGEARWQEEDNWTWEHFTPEQQERILDKKEDFITNGSNESVPNRWRDGEVTADQMEDWLEENVHLDYNSIIEVTSESIEIEYLADVSDIFGQMEEDIDNQIAILIAQHTDITDGKFPVAPKDFAHEMCHFLRTNASMRAAVKSFKDKLGKKVDSGEWLRRHYAKLRGHDKFLDQTIDKKFGTVLKQKEFDFIEDSEATRAAWSKVAKEAKNMDIFDTPEFEKLLLNACSAVYEMIKMEVYVPGTDVSWPRFRNADDIPFTFNSPTAIFEPYEFDDHDFEQDVAMPFKYALDQNLEENAANTDFKIHSGYAPYITELWDYCYGENEENYLERKFSSKDEDVEDTYKKERIVQAIYKVLTGKDYP